MNYRLTSIVALRGWRFPYIGHPPFEILLVAFAWYFSSSTLVACWLDFVALQTLFLACVTS